MAVAYSNVSVRLMAASVTSMPLYKRHQVTIGKSGSKEGELGEGDRFDTRAFKV